MTVPVLAPAPWLKTVQGDWEAILATQFGGDYWALVRHLAGFSTLILSNVVGFGPQSRFPFPKYFAGDYTPGSDEILLQGRGPRQFLADIRSVNPEIRIFIYSSPALDAVFPGWNGATGMPQPGWWYEGAWENLETSLAAIAEVSDLVQGVYYDIFAEPYLTAAQRDAAVLKAKAHGFYVALNIMSPSYINAGFAVKAPLLGHGDLIFCEGWIVDGGQDVTKESLDLGEFMSRQVVPLAVVVEEAFDTPIAAMQTGPCYDNWIRGYTAWLNRAKAGWLVEHNSNYAYVAQCREGA